MKLAKKKSLWLFRAHPFQSPNILDDSSSEPLQVSRSPSKSPAKDLKSSQSSFTVQLTELSSAALLNVGNLSPRPTIPDVEYHAATQTPLANVKNETTQSAQHSQTTLATPPQARDMQQEYWQLELDATRAIEDLQQKLAKEMAISKSLERENHQLRLQELDVRRVEQDAAGEKFKLMEQIEKLEFEHGELQQTVKEKLNVIEVQEKDFRMFSRKIQSQQRDNEALKISLRHAQFETPERDDNYYKQKLDDALFDNESLKLLLKEMKEGQESSNTIRSSSRASVARAMSTTPIRAEIIKPVDTWASPREQESRLQEYTLQKPQDPLEGLEYFERRNALDVELQYLMREKQTWTSELSRIPSTGGTGKTRAKLSQIETVLDDIDHRISTTRKRMRDLGVL